MASSPVLSLPEDYREAKHLLLTSPQNLAMLNVASLVLLALFFALMIVWTAIVRDLRGVYSADVGLPDILLWLAVLLVLPLHEWIHGLAIQWAGHHPRYGAKTVSVGGIKIPYILFATADNALFRRFEFIVIALAPVMVITLLGMGMIYVLSDSLTTFVVVAVILNGSGAIGDLWMTAAVMRYPADSLVRDEEDGIRIFIKENSSNN
ncbi:MAG: DUF3267 domain-containing protein [Chitinophagaceae bacterium]|nr:DUF3267 domain-containing protein [Anaerolineae bacterium]